MSFIRWCRDAAYWKPGGPVNSLLFFLGEGESRLLDLFPDFSISLHWGPKHTFVLCGTVSRIEQVSSTLCFKKPAYAIIRTENLCSLESCHSWGLFCVCLNSECFMSKFLLTIICSGPHTETSLKLCSCHIDSVQQFQMSGFLFFCLVFFQYSIGRYLITSF